MRAPSGGAGGSGGDDGQQGEADDARVSVHPSSGGRSKRARIDRGGGEGDWDRAGSSRGSGGGGGGRASVSGGSFRDLFPVCLRGLLSGTGSHVAVFGYCRFGRALAVLLTVSDHGNR